MSLTLVPICDYSHTCRSAGHYSIIQTITTGLFTSHHLTSTTVSGHLCHDIYLLVSDYYFYFWRQVWSIANFFHYLCVDRELIIDEFEVVVQQVWPGQSWCWVLWIVHGAHLCIHACLPFLISVSGGSRMLVHLAKMSFMPQLRYPDVSGKVGLGNLLLTHFSIICSLQPSLVLCTLYIANSN